jgi:hypothetical protein
LEKAVGGTLRVPAEVEILKTESGIRLDLALVHHPVYNKNGETIGSAVTNLDLHDIARASRTYGVDTYYIVTPFEDQQVLVQDIVDHWLKGHGAVYNGKRGEALSLIRICQDLPALYAEVEKKWGERPTVLVTSAREMGNVWSFDAVRQGLREGGCFLILFGTAWGIAPEVLHDVDGQLPSLKGAGNYNHLSVRSAAAIVLDRLLSNSGEN